MDSGEDTLRGWLDIAVAEAVTGRDEGGIPIGAALIGREGQVLGRGHNRRIQDDDPSVHGETDAFRRAGRQASYRGTTMVTTLSPCWYCSGLVRQFGISRVVIGEATTFSITAIVGTFASGGTQAPNWTRFARTPLQGFVAGLIAFFVGELLMVFFGGIGALAFGIGDFVEVLFALNLVGWGLVFLVANLWTTNDNTAYNFGVAGAELFNANTKKPFVIGGVVIGTLLAMPIYGNLIGYLSWLGILIPPIGGVIIGDWIVHWRAGMPEPLAYDFPAVRWGNLAVYAVRPSWPGCRRSTAGSCRRSTASSLSSSASSPSAAS